MAKRSVKSKTSRYTSTIRSRAWSDFQHLSRSNRFTVFAVGIAAIGAGVGALAPPDASPGERFLFAAIAALGASLFTYFAALTWALLSTPFRQRRELIRIQLASESAPRPIMEIFPEVKYEERKPISFEPTWIRSVGLVRIYNAQEHGGDEATARNVVPELEVFGPDEKRLYSHKGWPGSDARDFTTGQEEDRLPIAAKRLDRDGFELIDGKLKRVMSLDDGTYLVRITLRGYLNDGSFAKAFSLSSNGANSNLELVDAEPQSQRGQSAR